MPDPKKLAEKYRSLASVPPPAVEVPAAVVPSTPAPKPEPVAAPAPTPTAALPTAPTAKTPVAARPKVRKPAAPKPLVIDLKQTPTTEQALRAATPKPIIAPAEAERVVAQQRVKEEKKAEAAAATVPAAGQAASELVDTGFDQADVMSGTAFDESRKKLKSFYSAQAAIARRAKAAGETLDPQEIRRRAAESVMFKIPGVENVAKKPALTSPLTALMNVPAAVGTLTRTAPSVVDRSAAVDEELKRLDRLEKFVRERETKSADPLTNRLLQDVDRQMKQFKGKKTETIAPKIIRDFKEKYADEYMVQRGLDKLKNTDPAAYKSYREQAEFAANDVIDNLRVIGHPVFRAGAGLVSVDSVNEAFKKGTVEGLKEMGRVFLPQEVVTAGGEAVRIESIPMTVLRDIDAPLAVVSGVLGGGGDPFARIQRGQTVLADVLENDKIRSALSSESSMQDRIMASAVIAAAMTAEIVAPGLEVAAAPVVAGVAAGASRLGEIGLNVSDAVKMASTGKIRVWDDALGESRVIPLAEIPDALTRTKEIAKRAYSTYQTTKDPKKLVSEVATSTGISSSLPYVPAEVNIGLDAANPAVATVYRSKFLKNVSDNGLLNDALDMIKTDLVERKVPGADDEFRILASRDADTVVDDITGIRDRAQQAVDEAKLARETARAELASTKAMPPTPSTLTKIKELEKSIGEFSSAISAGERRIRKADDLLKANPEAIAQAIHDASKNALGEMLESPMLGRDIDRVSDVEPVARIVPSASNIDIAEVKRAMGGVLASPEDARTIANIESLSDFLKGRTSKSATTAEKVFANDIVAALEQNDAVRVVIDGLMKEGVADPFDILRLLQKMDAEKLGEAASILERKYDDLVRKQIEAEVEINRILEKNIAIEEGAVQLDRFKADLDDAVETARQASSDLIRARKIKVPREAVKRVLDEMIAERLAAQRVPAPTVDVSPAAFADASNADIAGDITSTVVNDADASVFVVQTESERLRAAQIALGESVTDKIKRRIIEMRYGKNRKYPFAVSGEPMDRYDLLMTQRPDPKYVPNKKHSYNLHRTRTQNNNAKYIMQDGPAHRKALEPVLKQYEASGDPRAKSLREFLESGSVRNDTARAEFARRMGIPELKDYITVEKSFDKGGLDEVYAKFDADAAARPDVPRARGENVYYRWLLNRSAPDGVPPGVVRMDDVVEVRNPDVARRAGPIKQYVVMPDGTTRFAEEGFVGDRFMGSVVGAVKKDDKLYAVVDIHEFSTGERWPRRTGRTIEVPVDDLALSERGRAFDIRFGSKGGEIPYYRPMLESEWADLAASEAEIFGDLAGELRYSEDLNQHVYGELNPPKRPTPEDFDFFTEADLMDTPAIDRQITRPNVVPEDEVAAIPAEISDVDRATDKVFVMGKPPEEPAVKVAATKPLSERSRRVGRLKLTAVETASMRRSDALERLDQARKALDDARAAVPRGKIQQARIQQLEQKIADLDAAKDALRPKVVDQQKAAIAAEEYKRMVGDVFEDVIDPRRKMADRLEAARRESTAILAEERVIAKKAGEEGRLKPSLEQEVREEIRRNAVARGGVAEYIRGVARLAGPARQVVESTIPQSLREVNKNIRLNEEEANRIIIDAVRRQNAKDPAEILTVAMSDIDASKYGSTWQAATKDGRLNERAVEGVAFAYVDNVDDLSDVAKEALKKIVREGAPSTQELSQAVYEYTRRSGIPTRDRAVGDLQLIQSVAAQSVADAAITESFSAGALFTRKEAAQIQAWFKGGTGRDAARGRELALSIMSSAVDSSLPITRLSDLTNTIAGRSVVQAINATAAEVAADVSIGAGKAASLDAFADVYAGKVFLPAPVAFELNKTIEQMISATRTRSDLGYSSAYKRYIVYGTLIPRTGFYYNNTMQDADQVAVGIGTAAAVRTAAAGALNMLPTVYGVSIGTGIADLVRGARAGTSAQNVMGAVAKVEDWLMLSGFGTDATKVMNRSADIIPGTGLTGEALWQIGTREGVGETMQSADIARDLDKTFRSSGSRWYATVFTEQTKEIGELVTSRKRWGAYATLVQENIRKAGGLAEVGEEGARKIAQDTARQVTDAFMDYSANLHPIERNWIMNVLNPFWAYDKSNMIRVMRLMTTDGSRLKGAYAAAAAGYRFGRWTRGKKALADLASFYFEQHDMYGFDVESMKKDDETRAEGEKLYPLYVQAIENAKTAGLDPITVRESGPYSSDERLDLFSTFTDYFQPKPPVFFEPDEYSRYRAPYAIVVADAKLQSWSIYNDYLDPKNKIGDEDKYTYIQPPDDGNLYAFMRPIAMTNLMGVAADMVSGKEDPLRANKVTENIVDIVGDPIGFMPAAQAIAETVLKSYDKDNITNIAPIRVDDTTGKMLHSMGLAVLENKVTTVNMVETEFGSVQTKVEPGYYVPKHTAVSMRALMPDVVAILGGVSVTGDMIEMQAKLVEETDERVRADIIRQMRKSLAGMASKNVSVQKIEAGQTGKIIGNIVRYGQGAGSRMEVPLTAEGIRREAVQKGEAKADIEAQTQRVYRDAIIEKSAMSIPEEDLRAVALADGLITPEQSDTTSRAQLLSMVRDSPKARVILREGGQTALDGMATLERQQLSIKRANDKMIKGIADPFQVSIARAALANQGVDVDAMSHEQVRELLRSH